MLGFAFGMVYAAFYLFIGHFWGVWIVSICSVGFLATPFLMRALRSASFGGNFLAAMMALGFTALCYVEGGLRGHAVAWLASVPLCALLLAGKRAARIWVVISFAAAASVVGFDLAEIRLPVKYDMAWDPLVSSAGYLGLIVFMFALGLIFEIGREEAFGKMTDALGTLELANQRLSVLNQEKTEFLGIAAHDLRNPLTVMLTYAEILREGDRPHKATQFGERIYEAGKRMRDLIVNLLDANAIEEGRISCKIERCEVEKLVSQSIEQNQINATRKGSEIDVSVPVSLCAKTDQSTAVQVLDNLISNALKYAPPQTRVEVRAGLEEENIFISVRDQGPGLSVEDQAKLFGKFTRLTAQPTGGESSTGLGLSIVKRLAEAMNGSVVCESVLGEGATFIVRLPVWDEENTSVAA
ncbi:MAG: sensor histidine kinase [Chthoniobacterales bacterium]